MDRKIFKEQRLASIQELLESNPTVNVRELAERFGVSVITIRRDLAQLHSYGLIERTHGGAASTEMLKYLNFPSFQLHTNIQKEEKRRIGKYSASLIKPGSTIYIGAGTTTYWMAKNLYSAGSLTVVTNSLPLANLIAHIETIDLILVGGSLNRKQYTLGGDLADIILNQLHFDLAVMGIQAIHPQFGCTSFYPQEVTMDRKFLLASDNSMLVADHTKFGKIGTFKTADIDAIRTIITDNAAPLDLVDTIRKKGVQVIMV